MILHKDKPVQVQSRTGLKIGSHNRILPSIRQSQLCTSVVEVFYYFYRTQPKYT